MLYKTNILAESVLSKVYDGYEEDTSLQRCGQAKWTNVDLYLKEHTCLRTFNHTDFPKSAPGPRYADNCVFFSI